MHIIIIGNGIAGISTARHIRKLSDNHITVISSETDHFFSRTALMYIYMGHMTYDHTKPYADDFWAKNKIELKREKVIGIDPKKKVISLKGGDTHSYDKLILATGSSPNKFGWPGQDLKGVQGLYSYPDLISMEDYTRGLEQAVIVGGGLIGIEMAEMFHSRHIPVVFLVREKAFWDIVLPAEESDMVSRHIREQDGINLRLETELEEILGDDHGRARLIRTKSGEEIPCQFVGLTAGVHPNIGLAEGSGIETNRGFLVNEYLETNIPDIYAAGDCAELRSPAPGRRGIEAVWYTGKRMGPVLARTICGERTPFDQGIWFNSAKFFDIEYQVYGDVPQGETEGISQLYWEHPGGRKAVRLVFETESGKILGFNLMGIRYRQEVCEKWIGSGAHIEEVLRDLGAANFDPEFFRQYEGELVSLYNRRFPGSNVQLKSKRGLRNVFRLMGIR
jgi:NAD(P)H-nitrite reductase large subunit